MRLLQAILLLIFLSVLAIFCFENKAMLSLRFLRWNLPSLPTSLVLVGTYLLGMISGWTVVGFVRRSLRNVETLATERREARADV
jgi:uncharacterized integral membrane protein